MDWERKASESGQGPVGSWKLEEGGAETLPRTLANLEGRGRAISSSQPLGPFIHSTPFLTWFAFGLLDERGLKVSPKPILNTFFPSNAN